LASISFTTKLLYNRSVVKEPQMPLNNVLGRPVVGDDFFDRDRDMARIWRRLENDNILLLAPRRVGKTSLLHRVEQTAEQHGARTVYVSAADRSREIDFIVKLYEAIGRLESGSKAAGAALRRLGRRMPRLKKIEVAKVLTAEFADASANEWQELGDALLGALRETEQRWVFLIDELPLFVLTLLGHGRERTRAFLNWFREARIDQTANLSVRWLLAGSIGLDTVTARERLGDTINDLAIESLGPFSPEDADRFLQELAKSHGLALEPDVRTHVLEKLGWPIPYHLQLVFSALLDLGVTRPSTADADRAYESLLGPARKASFDWWVQRLHEELGKLDADHALEVLAAVARDEQGASRSVLTELLRARAVNDEGHHRFLLDALENDGYLVVDEGRYVFRSPLLRDYWRARVLP
jgi:uncharacterized protein